ncbi:non-homologous end-joining DNA ligase [Chelativorans xinjiangense]|uniref:non-homologous end-joining DNA ligase n=1 Tax=Chelativorans xinjiangense TaxID=2681485 RepID=UPI001FE68685|nr:non-homologous end-joining DNA ligase [Chelativorans xinjiangense]
MIEKATNRAANGERSVIAGIRLSHPERILFKEQGVTKRDLAAYMERASGHMLPYLKGRLLSLVRCPQGKARQCFFQRHGSAGMPQQFHRLDVHQKKGGEREYLYIRDAAGLVAAAQIGVLELHVWGSRVDDIERPDRLVFDLDPDPTVNFEKVKEAAVHMRDILETHGLSSFPLLTGGKGIHVVCPLVRRYRWPTIKAFAKALAVRMAEDDPGRYVATMSKAKRKGRIFIDYFRNERGASAIAPFSPRARKGAPLAWPVDWDELGSIDAADVFRLGEADPQAVSAWRSYGDRQGLKAATLRALEVRAEEVLRPNFDP